MRFEENDYVYKEGEHAAEMYFIVRGEVAQGFLKADEFVPYMTIEEGYYFGELDLMFSDQ
jgi:CRP-like cAMP-binding protein